MTANDELPDDYATHRSGTEPDEYLVLRQVVPGDEPALVDAFRIATQAATRLREVLAAAGYPEWVLARVLPSLADDGTPVVWVHLGGGEESRRDVMVGGAGPPPPTPP